MTSKDTDGKVVIEGREPRKASAEVPVSPKPPGAKPAKQASVIQEVIPEVDEPAKNS